MSGPGRVPWAYDVPGVSGIAVRRWWGTLWHLLRPSRFWERLGSEPLVARRAVMWLVLTLAMFHAVHVGSQLGVRAVNVAKWSSPGQPFPFWQSLGVTLEMLLSPYYDQGEMNARQVVEPMYFLDRFRVALACGSLVAGLTLALLGAIRPGAVRRPVLIRSVVYGMMPLAFSYVLLSVMSVLQVLLGQVLGLDMRWWYGWPTPTGRIPGGSTWLVRAANVACVAWMASWWWHGAGAVLERSGRWARLLVVGVALGTAAAIFIWYLNHWARWGML